MSDSMSQHGMKALVAMVIGWMLASAVWAADQGLLIQVQPGGAYRVWHSDGPTKLSDDEIMLLDSEATPEGGRIVPTAVGPATATQTAVGVVISLPEAPTDRALLVDRDGCGHVKTWHAEGATRLNDDQLTDLVLAAIPGGGKRVVLSEGLYAKSFLTNLGVMVAIWRPVAKPAR
jgi:hypothetical protein